MTTTQEQAAPKRGRRITKILSFGVLALLLAVGAFAGFVLWRSEHGMQQRMNVAAEELSIPVDSEAITRGRKLAVTRGCLECHAPDGGGRVLIEAMPVIEVRTPNLTTGGPTAAWSGRDWARAVRHGVRPDGSVILFMPASDFRFMDSRDLGAIVAYLRTLPPVQRDMGRTAPGIVGRLLYVLGQLPLVPAELVDHQAPVPDAPPAGPTAQYGAYLAQACAGCHGERFSGGKIPGTPPEWPAAANLTPDATGLAQATEEQFVAAVTQGRRRTGGTIDPQYMPWRQLKELSPDEIRALWLFLRSVPARPAGRR